MRIAILVLGLLLAGAPVHAGEAEVKAAQAVIDGQIAAFRAGDNVSAYGFASPGIKRIFPTLESFMGMVGGYQPVYRPKSYAFGKAEELGNGRILQRVMVVGPDGKDYEAVYILERQPDGTFRISGVSLHEANTVST
jgi:hypothetical protein